MRPPSRSRNPSGCSTASTPGSRSTCTSWAGCLKAIGVPPQLARHASLMDIGSEFPAVVISRLLGFHQSTGENWTREAKASVPTTLQKLAADYSNDLRNDCHLTKVLAVHLSERGTP